MDSNSALADLAAQLGGSATVTIGGSGKDAVITGDLVKFHEGQYISVPEGMTYKRAREILDRLEREAETMTDVNRLFRYSIWDGVVAVNRVVKRVYGATFGIAQHSFFGTTPPQTVDLATDVGVVEQFPWGTIALPTLGDDAKLEITGTKKDGVTCLYLVASVRKKHSPKIEEFFRAVEEELKTNSIYRAKSIVGTSGTPEFLDLRQFNPDEVVFSDEALATMNGTLWSVLEHRDVLKAEGIRTKRSVLLEGPYGTGKTSAGFLTAQKANENDWTFISAKPGENINDVLSFARLYQPSVVFFEDVDGQASSADDHEVQQLLESFDGLTSKGAELCLVMTTNHYERIHKGMLRPGRIDAVIPIRDLDRGGVEKLIKAIVPADKLAKTVDFDEVYASMEQFLPAFVREALERAKTYAIARLGGTTGYVLDTPDLVAAARGLRPQLEDQLLAREGEKPVEFTEAFGRAIEGAIPSTIVYGASADGDDVFGTLRKPLN
ncbi:AAA-ATPase [Gordonia phage Guey18]|nr:AAA-ATPase [Gordonia phage Guey18]